MAEDKTKEKKGENVTIPKSTLEKLLARVDRLEFAASKAQLAHFDERNKESLGKKASVSAYEDKIVTAWKIVEDIVEKNPTTGVWMERQTIRLWFLGEDEHQDMPYQQFVRRHSKKSVKIKRESRMEDGRQVWEVETDDIDPITFEIDVTFLN